MSWPIVKLVQICSRIDYGLTASAIDTNDGPRFLRITDIQDNNVDWSTVPSCQCSLKELEDNRLENGDIVFARTGATTGKSFLIKELNIDSVFASYLIRIRPNYKVNPLYLSYYFKSSKYWHQITRMANGVAQPGINSTKLKELEIPLPPLKEQHRIASILDRADKICQKRKQSITLADDFLRATFFEVFGDPVKNPKRWKTDKIKKGILAINSGWSANGENTPCKSDEIGVLKISSVTSGVFKPEENKVVAYKSIPASKKLIHPKKGDLLFSRANTRELVAAICMVHQDYDNLFLPDKLWSIKLNHDLLLPEFFLILIQNEKVRDLLTKQATGTSGSMLNISKRKFEETEIIFPEINVQKDFCNAFRKTMNLKTKLMKSNELAIESFNSLSQKVF